MYRKAIVAALSTSLLFSAPFVVEAGNQEVKNPSSHAFDNKIIKKIDADAMYDRIDFLSKQPREAGT
ncbi:hypothetical protein N781_08845 [Pontibacillus halophilus JSM 076056 = DSM 19796]|uniref:Uncharacterized protein n=1 Tax=Pontibacillus halophilus JSM 076056 = DSM 19796 TaxID=1385510 RepID=A0A0A5GFL6_9BACI|nr:hypothetical protein [Pontibacillus halophilus]KGX89988.1 hypothetical protein N781_08845 [Pontibacillus halophilus JSM 076056 = DSM 19796]